MDDPRSPNEGDAVVLNAADVVTKVPGDLTLFDDQLSGVRYSPGVNRRSGCSLKQPIAEGKVAQRIR